MKRWVRMPMHQRNYEAPLSWSWRYFATKLYFLGLSVKCIKERENPFHVDARTHSERNPALFFPLPTASQCNALRCRIDECVKGNDRVLNPFVMCRQLSARLSRNLKRRWLMTGFTLIIFYVGVRVRYGSSWMDPIAVLCLRPRSSTIGEGGTSATTNRHQL